MMKERLTARVGQAIVACALFGTMAHAQRAPAAIPSVITVEPEVQAKSLVVPFPKARLVNPSRIFNVTLPLVSLPALGKSATESRLGVPLQIGFARPVPGLETVAAMGARLDWQATSAGSRVAAFSVTSSEAQSLRVGLRIFKMPAEALLRFYAPTEGEVFEATGAQAREAIERNLNAGEEGEDARTYWSPLIEGETAVVEIELPAGTSAESFGIAAPAVSHLVTSPSRNFAMPAAKAAAASCELDVMCYSAWSNESSAVARIAFTSGGQSFLCSGTLLADSVPATQVPFFLTANHCVSTQASASSLQSFWFYRSTACDSGVRGASVTLGGGATLLYASAVTDTSFLRLNSTPPGGAVYAGWQVGSVPPLGTSVAGIHHPGGDLQKISFGNMSSYDMCAASSPGQFTCRAASSPLATFYESAWSSGITEPGSSGSGIFLSNGHYLVGQLYGGTSSCGNAGSDFYGRFDVAYNTALAPYLNGTSTTPTPTPPPGSGTTVQPPPPTFVPAFNYSALWWNSSESGWGLSVTQHNAALFAAWFVYNSAGNPRWVVMPGGTWTSPTSITGDLYSTSGPASVNNFDPSQVSTLRVGSATLTFSSATNGVLAYTVDGVSGTKVITQQPFGVPDTTPTANYADLWWNSSESGWGLSIAQQNRTLFAVWYAYGAFGQPQWYVLPGGTWSGNTYTGALYRTASAPAPFYGGAFDPKGVSVSVAGSMSLTFSGVSSAIMSFTLDGVDGSVTITRQPF